MTKWNIIMKHEVTSPVIYSSKAAVYVIWHRHWHNSQVRKNYIAFTEQIFLTGTFLHSPSFFFLLCKQYYSLVLNKQSHFNKLALGNTAKWINWEIQSKKDVLYFCISSFFQDKEYFWCYRTNFFLTCILVIASILFSNY